MSCAVGLGLGAGRSPAETKVYRNLKLYRPTVTTNDIYFYHPATEPALQYNHDVDIVKFKGRFFAAWNANAKPAEGVPGQYNFLSVSDDFRGWSRPVRLFYKEGGCENPVETDNQWQPIFVNDRDELWWSKGGELIGATPERIGFLARIVAEAPNGVLDPCPSDWDLPWGGVEGEYLVGYFGFCAPRYRTVRLPEGEFRVDVIDTWNMTVEPLAGTYREQVEVPMPARPWMAIRLVRLGE